MASIQTSEDEQGSEPPPRYYGTPAQAAALMNNTTAYLKGMSQAGWDKVSRAAAEQLRDTVQAALDQQRDPQ